MKQIIFSFLFFISSFSIFSQQIAKELVVVEIATGTWCYYCPGGAMGADELVENFGDAVAIIENHNGDNYANASSNTRNSFNGVGGIPDTRFNGLNPVVGGNHTQSMYSTFLPIYNNAISVLTSFGITMEVIPINDYTFDVTVTIDKVHDYTGTNLVAHLALTESHIEETWQGMSELNFVNRAMYPSASGTTLDFSSATQQIINYTVTLDEEWVSEECELVVFVQDNNSKEILQGTKTGLNISIGTNNVMIKEINYPSGNIEICEDAISPVITVKNKGSENLTSFDVEYEINSEGVQTYNWTGNLAFAETVEIVLDEIVYSPVAENTLEINLTSPNGTTDDDLTNNSMSVSFDKAAEATTNVYIEIDPNGSWTLPWQLVNSVGMVLYQGNASGFDIINEVFELDINECYSLAIEYTGNGIPGDGFFLMENSDGTDIYYGLGSSFSEDVTVPFKVTTISGIEENNLKNISVYPNPANKYIYINSTNYLINQITLTNISGKEVFSDFSNKNKAEFSIDISSFNSGIYFVNIYTEAGIITRKISVIN